MNSILVGMPGAFTFAIVHNMAHKHMHEFVQLFAKNMSETKSRFMGVAGGNPNDRGNANKTKMNSDSVHIGGSNSHFNVTTTSGSFFYNKDASNRHLNQNEQ